MKYRISKKVLASLPAPVATAIKAMQTRYSDHTGKPHFSSFTLRHYNEGFQMYHGEGEVIEYIYGENTVQGEIQSENNHAGIKIGYGPKLPAGTVALSVGYMGGYYLSVIAVGYPGIEG